MAQKLVVGLTTYLTDFAGGQSAFRSPPYIQYATDLDTNFLTLFTTVNQIIDELAAVQGPNAGLGIDMLVFDDPARGAAALSGLVGLSSFSCTITTTTVANDSVTVQKGVAIINSQAVRNASGAIKVGSGGAGTRWIAIDALGAVYLETAANQRALDLYSVSWSGTAFTGAFTRLTEIFFDGDEYEDLRKRVASGTSPISFPTQTFDQVFQRVQAIERMLAGLTTDSTGASLGQPAIRPGTAAAPGLAVESDPNTGVYSPGADQWAITTGGTQRLAVSTAAVTAALALLIIAGTAGAPGLAISGDTDTGLFSPGANRLALATAGAQALEVDATGNIDLALNSRVKGVRTTAQSITDATATFVDFNATDEFDVGTWHDAASGTTSVRESFTVPTGADGLYAVTADFNFAGHIHATLLLIEVTVNGTPDGSVWKRETSSGGNDIAGQLSLTRALAAADVVKMRVTRTDLGGADATNLNRATLTIRKVA